MPTPRRKSPKSHAFSVIEIALGLVIVSLIMLGSMTAVNLMEAAKIRSVIVDISNFKHMFDDFQTKHRALPGDMLLAFDFWGSDCGGNNTAANGGCNGDGDYQIEWDDKEGVKAWQLLHLAGMMGDIAYTGACNGIGSCDAVVGENVPHSSFDNGGYFLDFDSTSIGNYIGFGASTTTNENNTPILLPEQASNIDVKIDDGLPVLGKVRADGTVNCHNNVVYRLNREDKECFLLFTVRR